MRNYISVILTAFVGAFLGYATAHQGGLSTTSTAVAMIVDAAVFAGGAVYHLFQASPAGAPAQIDPEAFAAAVSSALEPLLKVHHEALVRLVDQVEKVAGSPPAAQASAPKP